MQVVEDFKAATLKFPECVECYALYAKVLQEIGDMEVRARTSYHHCLLP